MALEDKLPEEETEEETEQEKSKKRKQTYWNFINTKEDAIKYYDKNYVGKSCTQLRQTAVGKSFYEFLRRKTWIDIVTRQINNWSFIKTEEDAIKYYVENHLGKIVAQVVKDDPKFYDFLNRKGWANILLKKENYWMNLIKTKEDAIKVYNESYIGKSRSWIFKHKSGFFCLLKRNGWLSIIPKKQEHKDWDFIKTKEDAIKYCNENYADKTASQISLCGNGFYYLLRRKNWLDIIPKEEKKERKDWSFIKTEEDAIKHYNENHAGLTSRQVKEKDPKFYSLLQERGLLDILPKGRNDWENTIKTREDAIRYIQENFSGKSASQVDKVATGFYQFLNRKDWTDILPKAVNLWNDTIKSKEDAQKYINANFANKTKEDVRRESMSFYSFLHRFGWLDLLPRQKKDWSGIKTREDAIKCYNEHYAGMSANQLPSRFYAIICGNNWQDILHRKIKDWSFMKTREDAIKYYNENHAGKTYAQFRHIDGSFYHILCENGWLDILPKQGISWKNIIKTKDDAIKYYNENFAGLTSSQIVEDRDKRKFYDFLERKGWLDILPKKRKVFGQNLRDYSDSSPTESEVGDNLFNGTGNGYGNGNGNGVKEIDFGASLEDVVDYISQDEGSVQDSQVKKLLRLLGEQNSKESVFALNYTDRPELVQLYNAGISCSQTSSALLYKVFDILNSDGKETHKILDLGGAHGCASIKAKREFKEKQQKDLEMTIADMDETGVNIAKRESKGDVEVVRMALPYSSFKKDANYDLITATYFFCELNPQEIKETVQQLPESKYFFATLPPSNTEKRDVLIQSLKEKGYKIRYGLFPVKLEDSKGEKFKYTVIAVGGTKQ